MSLRESSQDETRCLLDWVMRQHPETPKARAKQWILAGRITVNGAIIRRPQQQMLNPGRSLRLLDRRAATLDSKAGLLIHPLVSLVHLDPALAVLNKGPGVVSVPAPNCHTSALGILAEFLATKPVRAHVARGHSIPPSCRGLKPLPVHRLDQYTSGVFCSAMNAEARSNLIRQLKAHTMQREYMAFVDGKPAHTRGTWRHWLKLSADELTQTIITEREAQSAASQAREAVTHFEVVAEFPGQGRDGVVTKLRLMLETGLKHQIRIQAAFLGFPLIGDRTYHAGYRDSEAPKRIPFPRQALHARSLTLDHPETGVRSTWAANLPSDLIELETRLKARIR